MLAISDYRPSVLSAAEAARIKMSSGKVLTDEEVLGIVTDITFSDAYFQLRPIREITSFIKKVFATLRCELEILQEYSDDKSVTEIMVNGPKDIFVEKNGKIIKVEAEFENVQHLERVIQRLAAKVGREINDLNPIVDARLSDGSRINAVHSNVAINGPILTIRKFTQSRMTMGDLINNGDISMDAATFIEKLVECGYNIFVSGGTSSGKTTFLNILSDFIPPDERVIVIEDSAELQIRGHENLVRMEVKAANAQGKGSVSMRDLIKASLRMRPDRIIVGEVRGSEVIDMISAMSTGHDGSLSTGHANSASGMLKRIETMYLSGIEYPLDAVRSTIAEAIDIVIHLRRFNDGHRRVVEISELLGYENGIPVMNELFKYKQNEGLTKTGNKLKCRDKLQRIYPDCDGTD